MYSYYNSDNINGEKLNIRNKYSNNKNILAYASSPEIKSSDISINILSNDLSIEKTLIPKKNEDLSNANNEIFEVDLGIVNESQEYLTTVIYDDNNNPLYYIEELGDVDNIINYKVYKNNIEYNEKHRLLERENKYYLIHNFNLTDNFEIVIHNKDNELQVKIPIFTTLFKKVNKSNSLITPGNIYWINGNKLFLRQELIKNEYKILSSKDFRGRIPLIYNFIGKAKVKYNKYEKKKIKVGVTSISNNLNLNITNDNIYYGYGFFSIIVNNINPLNYYNKEFIIEIKNGNKILLNKIVLLNSGNLIEGANDEFSIELYVEDIEDEVDQNAEFTCNIKRYSSYNTNKLLDTLDQYLDSFEIDHESSKTISLEEMKENYEDYEVVFIIGEHSIEDDDLLEILNKANDNRTNTLFILDCYSDIQDNGIVFEITSQNPVGDIDSISILNENSNNPITDYAAISTYTRVDYSNISGNPFSGNTIAEIEAFLKNNCFFVNSLSSFNNFEVDDAYDGYFHSNKCYGSFVNENINLYYNSNYTSYFSKWEVANINTVSINEESIYTNNNLVISAQAITSSKNNSNIKNGIKKIEELLKEHFSIISFETPIEKDYLFTKNVLKDIDYKINNYELGYEPVSAEKKNFVARKIITENPLNYIRSFFGLNIEKIESLQCKIYNENLQCIYEEESENENKEDFIETEIGVCYNTIKKENPNNTIYFYALKELIATDGPETREYNNIDNSKESINLDLFLEGIRDGHTYNKIVSKTYELSYLPRKKIICKLKDLIINELDENLYDTIKISSLKQNVNFYIKDNKNINYYSKDGLPQIDINKLSDDIVVEASLTSYSISSSNIQMSYKNMDSNNDLIYIDKNLKTYNPWYLSIKNLDNITNDSDFTYIYKTPEFYKQSFIKDNIRFCEKEEAAFNNKQIIKTVHNKILEDQTLDIKDEILERISINIFCSKYPIYKIIDIKTNDNKTIKSDSYIIDGNLVIFNSEVSLDKNIICSYKRNIINVYSLNNDIKTASKKLLNIAYNTYNILKIGNKDDVLLNEDGFTLWKENIDNENISFVEINKDNILVLKDQGILIIKNENTPCRFFWSGTYCKKKNYNIENINSHYGYIFIKDKIDYREKIYVDYLYSENYFYYKGFLNNKLDFNPLPVHKYSIEGKEYDSIDLLNKTVLIYLKPYQIIDNNGFIIEENENTIFHSFDKEEFELIKQQPGIIPLAQVCLTNNYSVYDSFILDARTLGGGIKKDIDISSFDSNFFFDIDSRAQIIYNPNGFAVIKLPKQLLKENGGMFNNNEIEEIINMYRSVGTKFIIEYYDAKIEPIINKLN